MTFKETMVLTDITQRKGSKIVTRSPIHIANSWCQSRARSSTQTL